jgi:hypothetical protein
MEALLGVRQSGVWRGRQDAFNGTVDLIKQDLRFVDTLDTVTLTNVAVRELSHSTAAANNNNNNTVNTAAALANTTLVCKGVKSTFTVTSPIGLTESNAALPSADVLATFADGSPAAVRRSVGNGSAMYIGFLPGLSYFDTAIPLRPADRGSTDDNFNHFLPTDFNIAAKGLLTLPLASRLDDPSVVPVTSTESIVETVLITAPSRGTIVPCINWLGKQLANFTVTVSAAVVYNTASLSSGRAVVVSDDRKSFTFDLSATADVLILR